ncbi:circumsporozoite protein [Fusarium heterosporum]|uniref:Circumsporozoite protein n=1 Tax=Fusarium heterosporum TaxID=42747 RepID=A0A8H5TPN2_FUSHE|nr:circumsporozoite protein [Fusarium heterosporum]
MKSNFALLALTASLGEVSAHWGNWKDAPKYTPPQAIDNKCEEHQKKGWSWDDLQVGQFEKYNDWDFKGWTCGTDKSKRDLTGRHFGKSIFGECGSTKEQAPSFGCGAGSKEKEFSLHKFHVKPEFDCRLEFHYDMPDGSTCKHQADCSKDGTDVYNTQCGGAKKVHFVYPKQPNKPKDKCRIEVPQVDFNCDKPQPPKNTYTVPANTYTAPAEDTTSAPAAGETTTAPSAGETETLPAGDNTETVPAGDVTTSAPASGETTTAPASGETTTAPSAGETETLPAGENTKTVPAGDNTYTLPAGENTKTVPSGEETKTVPAGEETTAPSAGETETVPAGETETIPAGTETAPAGDKTTSGSSPAETTGPAGDNTETVPAGETKTVPAGETETSPAGDNTKTVPAGENTKTVPAGDKTTSGSSPAETTGPAGDSTETVPAGETKTVPAGETSVITTVYDSTSTVYTTDIKTITSCGPEVTNCPVTAGTPVIVTETVAISTTICPVTETLTGSKPGQTKPVEGGDKPSKPVEGGDKPSYTKPAGGKPAKTTEGSSPEGTSDVPVEATTIVTSYDKVSTVYATEVKTITHCGPEVTNCPANSATTAVVTETVAHTTAYPVVETITHKAPKPVQTGSEEKPEAPKAPEDGYNVPEVVPSCLNTFIEYIEDCKDNTDAACYCPSKEFVDNVFQCVYAHAKDDDTIAEAVSFFQGICAPYANQNPVIATGADAVTEHITVTGTTIITSAHYTTVTVATTITEPIVAGGSTVEGSSTVKTIETEIVVPEVGFTSGPAGNGPVPAQTPAPAPAQGTQAPGAPGYAAPPAGETLITGKPAVGTGGVPVPTATPGVPVTAGAARNGMGIAAAILAVAIAL